MTREPWVWDQLAAALPPELSFLLYSILGGPPADGAYLMRTADLQFTFNGWTVAVGTVVVTGGTKPAAEGGAT